MTDEKLPLTQHLEELRRRLIICMIAVGIGFAASYAFAQRLFLLLARPLSDLLPEGNTFIFTGITEGFFTYLKLAFFAGIFLAMPVILHQTWCFVAPGLYASEKKYVLPFVLLSTMFFIVGVLFGYYAVLPLAFNFFIGYNNEYIRMLPAMREYLSFSCKFLLAFGLVFELPIFILFLAKLGVVNEQQLRKNRKFVILIIFVVAAILTPPDVVSQVLMAVPLLVLYEISIGIARIFAKKTSASAEAPDA
jgi:sec-independent protein translocase protein TatC